jgi:hypothetical protein
MSNSPSLQDLNDVVLPLAVSWWPLAPAWYVLAAVLFLLALWFGWKKWRQWNRDRYRRAALETLRSLEDAGDQASLRQVPELLKRAALSCWPRNEVAALSGRPWHEFLDRSSASDHFCSGAGPLLDQLAYDDGKSLQEAEDQSTTVFAAADFWLKRHRRELTDE